MSQSRGDTAASLSLRFDHRRNSLNALRMALALAVIVSHSWAIGDFGPEPELGGAHLGTWAVLGFFAISGFLITSSRMRSTARRYYEARALRIVPALVVCLVVTAFVFAPVASLRSGDWSAQSALTYVARNVALYPPAVSQIGIEHTLETVPYSSMWNGSLWTLFWEASCYVAVGVLVSWVPKRRLSAVIAAAFMVASAGSLVVELGLVTAPDMVARSLPLAATFFAGALVYLWGGRILLGLPLAVGMVAVLVAAIAADLVQPLAAAPLALLLIWVGSSDRLRHVGGKYDASYGVYIYAWPVQQMTMLAFAAHLSVWSMIALSVMGTLPLAYLSCWAVEKPALRLKPRPTPRSLHADDAEHAESRS